MTSREQRKSRRHGISRTAVLVAAVLGCAMAAYAYLPMIEISSGTPLKWANNAASYQIATALGGSYFNSGQLSAIESTIQNAFAAWTGAPNTSVSVTWKSGTLPSPLIANDGHNVICFNCSDAAFSDANGSSTDTLAVTNISYQISSQGTFLYDTDMLFNPAVHYVLPPNAGAADGSTVSLQTVATHEAGHFLGLDHSAVQRAVMFPYISTLITTLSYDDVAAISSLYPKATPDYATGSLSGTISLATDGSAVYGAHVYASSTTGNAVSGSFNIRQSPIGTLTKPDGTYSISGLPPDSYTVTAEPLDGPVQDSNITWYDTSSRSVQTNFNTRWH